MSKEQRGAELDKLKRRMIRTVARLLNKEKKTEAQVWLELKKQSGANCKSLWERMRSLTMKKLKRLFDAEDLVDSVPSVARMTITDWLLYDLVIVHEKIDVIDRNRKSQSIVLRNLFSLVQMFSIEGRSGNDLAEAWTAATVHYNSKGHQCSPMLMQRRWYQVKELTRHKMYKFWFNYRGNQRLLAQANEDPPTDLQKAIALRYPEIITRPFPEWQERIEHRLVIMPEEFEVKMRNMAFKKPADESVPDVVIVEQKIDTITLGDSDQDNSDDDDNSIEPNFTSHNSDADADNDDTSQTPIIVQVKTEPQDGFQNNEQADSMYQQYEPSDRFQEEIERLKIMEDKILSDEENSRDVESRHIENQDIMVSQITNVSEAVDTDKGIRMQKNERTKNDIPITVAVSNTSETTVSVGSQESILIDDDDEDIIPLKQLSNAKSKTDQATEQSKYLMLDITSPDIKRKTSGDIIHSDDEITIENGLPTSFIVNADKTDPGFSNERANGEVLPVITSVASGAQVAAKIELDAEMPSENVEENEDYNLPVDLQDQPSIAIDLDITPEKEKKKNVIDLQGSDESVGNNICNVELSQNKHQSGNLDLTEGIISAMNFADGGIEFADDGIELDENEGEYKNDLSDCSCVEKRRAADEQQETSQNFDLKLLMNPVVYTTKLDEMTVYKQKSIFDTIHESKIVDKIILESKPTSVELINPSLPETNPSEVQIEIIDSDKHVTDDNNMNKNQEIHENLDNIENLDTYEGDDDLFHNDPSDESECEAIEESKKVKLSSNLLKKPRSRSYNPIQLCKNPDFNTRLKRLTVGFYTSPRNRVLLSACKPMTVDLSKAFECKLIDGTMYLKPSDQVIDLENHETVTESAVSIMPSANPVQSLMDTTDVDRILEEELKKRMLVRNKTITLPNISIVRQINQHLLMAEVAPIMSHINKSLPTVPADQRDAQESIERAMSDEAKSLKINPEPKMSNECADSLLIVRDKCPESVVTYTNADDTGKPTNENLTSLAITSQPIITDKNMSKLEKRKKVDMPNWITKKYYDIKNDSETLLTIDTLYKMLNALDPCQEYASRFNSYKSKTKRKVPISEPEKQKETAKPKPKPTPKPKSVKATDITKTRRRITRMCCWARTKLEKLQSPTPGLIRLNKHHCGGTCKCCCKQELENMELNMELIQTSNAVDSLSETIEAVVKQSHNLSNISQPAVHIVNVNQNTDAAAIRIDIGLQADIVNENENGKIINNSIDSMVPGTNADPDTVITKKPDNEPITINLDEEDEDNLSTIKSPKPRIRVHPATNYINSNDHGRVAPVRISNNISMNKMPLLTSNISKPSLGPRPILPVSQVTAGNYPIQAQKVFCKKLEDDIPCSCRPNVAVDSASATLLVDGSNACLRHSSCVSKETRIYLNRKHMSVNERPFYVGKNKILLTNIRQPEPQLLLPDPIPLKMPDGVQVVLLPDQTITYLVDPNVELTKEQIDSMPMILEAVKLHLNASGITLPINSDDYNVIQNEINTISDLNLQNANNTGGIVRETSHVNNLSEKLPPLLTSIQTANGDSNTDTESMLESGLECIKSNHQESTSNEVNDVSKIVTNTIVNNIDTKIESKINKDSTSNEATTVSESIIDSNSKVVQKFDIQNERSCELATNDVIGVVNTNTNNTETDKLHTDEVLTINVESAVLDAPEKVNPRLPTASTANVNAKDLESELNIPSEKSEISETVANLMKTDENISTKRNLFSDLMEMSGIGEEDIAPALQESVTVMTAPESVTALVSLPTDREVTLRPDLSVPPMSPEAEKKHTISAQIDDNIYELNPITCFAQLKYACDHNGLFFKLNLSNGLISPINVCIQKGPKTANKLNALSSDVIDLTDEEGVSLCDQTQATVTTVTTNVSENAKRNIKKLIPRKITSLMPVQADDTIEAMPDTMSMVKPVRLKPRSEKSTKLPAMTPLQIKRRTEKNSSNPSELASLLIQKPKNMNKSNISPQSAMILGKLSNNLKPLKTLQKHRLGVNILRKKSLLGSIVLPTRPYYKRRIDASINLVDSDVPMEEEYLVEESSDDSDDEPLAKIAKRIRAAENEQTQESSHVPQHEDITQDESMSQDEAATIDGENIYFEDVIDAMEPPIPLSPTLVEPVPTQLVLSGSALNEPILLNNIYIPSHEADDEDTQDDCILGV